MKINIDKIKIPPNWSVYSDIKFKKKEDKYLKTGKPGNIIIDDKNFIVDGYISYLVYKKYGVENIEVFHNSEDKKLYVYGIHPDSSCVKEYVWEVPKKMIDKFVKKVKPESKIYCNTKYGISPVIVKKIKWEYEDHKARSVNKY